MRCTNHSPNQPVPNVALRPTEISLTRRYIGQVLRVGNAASVVTSKCLRNIPTNLGYPVSKTRVYRTRYRVCMPKVTILDHCEDLGFRAFVERRAVAISLWPVAGRTSSIVS